MNEETSRRHITKLIQIPPYLFTGLSRETQHLCVVHLIRLLPSTNRDVLWALLRLLRNICTHSTNKDDSVSFISLKYGACPKIVTAVSFFGSDNFLNSDLVSVNDAYRFYFPSPTFEASRRSTAFTVTSPRVVAVDSRLEVDFNLGIQSPLGKLRSELDPIA